MRISLENPCDHVQAEHVRRFAERLESLAEGRLRVDFHCNADLYRDAEVTEVLTLGRIEMAAPGIWQLDREVPGMNVFMLPVFYGRSSEETLAAADGALGAELSARLERTGRFIVPGRWYALGHTHLFGVNKSLETYASLSGTSVRVAGGAANELRNEALGAKAVVVPWAELPEALRRRRVDAILTSYETVLTGGLMRYGVTSVFEDRQYFGLYVPLVSERFWRLLPEDLRALLRETWEETVEAQRNDAALSQHRARGLLVQAGLAVAVPSPEAVESARERLAGAAPGIARECGVDDGLLELARRQLEPRAGKDGQ